MFTGIVSILKTLVALCSEWLRRSETRHALSDLERDCLDDLGITAEMRNQECGKWFSES